MSQIHSRELSETGVKLRQGSLNDLCFQENQCGKMDNYENLLYVASGSYGSVYKATCKNTGDSVALKYHKNGVDSTCVREFSCLTMLKNHPHIIQMYGCFQHRDQIWMVMPYMPYTLEMIIHRETPPETGLVPEVLPLSFVAHVTVQIAKALEYIHRLNMVHRDLKPDNVLLSNDLSVKLADMGFARHCKEEMSSPVGARAYRAPELLLCDYTAKYTCAVDMWALGVLLADMIEGRITFLSIKSGARTFNLLGCQETTLSSRDCSPTEEPPLNLDSSMPNVTKCTEAKRILEKLLVYDYNNRLLAHEFLEDDEWTMLAAKFTMKERTTVLAYTNATKS